MLPIQGAAQMADLSLATNALTCRIAEAGWWSWRVCFLTFPNPRGTTGRPKAPRSDRFAGASGALRARPAAADSPEVVEAFLDEAADRVWFRSVHVNKESLSA